MVIRLFLLSIMCACTDAQWEKSTAFGNSTHIICYSGGTPFYDGYSTGKVSWLDGGGAFWKDKQTNALVETFADCIFKIE